jgi:hypothetical protein
MKESDLDSTAVSQIFAVSLTARGKHSPSQTWLRKWKADFWMRPLFSQMSQISHGQTTLHTWLEGFCPSVGLASPSPALESEKPQKTSDGSSTSSQTEFPFFAPECSSQRMSKDSSPQGCQTDQASSGIVSRDWKAYIIKLRQEYSLRVKSARLTSASGCLSWPTIRASEYKDTGPIGSKNHDHMLGKGYLCAVVTQDAANWPTPKANDPEKRGDFNPLDHRTGLPGAVKLQQHGQAAPANPSTDGSRPELSEQSQRNWQTFAHGTHNRGETPHRQVVKALVNGEKAQTQCLTVDQVFAEEIKGTNTKSWATPRSGKTTDENPETWAARQAKGDVATMPLTAQVKCWPTICAGDYRTPPTNSGISGQTIMPSSEHALPKAAGGKLNPRWVETLMGLPVGWTMPSCASPVTIEPTNSDSWATESCQPPPKELFEC